MSSCGLVILAAGAAARMGRPKQLLKLDGITLLQRCVRTALHTSCRPVVVVLGANAPLLAGELNPLDVTIVENPAWESGLGTSIRAGVKAIAHANSSLQAVALVLCDQPLISAAAIERLVASRAQSGKAICAAAYAGTIGTPAVFSAALFEELIALRDDQGGRIIIARHAAQTESIDLPQAAIDIDTEADFLRLQAGNPPF